MIIAVPVVVMVPMIISKNLTMDKGCWVKLYDSRNLEGDGLLLVSPINMVNLIGPFGVGWERFAALRTALTPMSPSSTIVISKMKTSSSIQI